MPLYIASLNSGSNGNCYYVGNNTEAVLIDAGLSRKETEKRMQRLGLPIKNIKAVFVSHEHGDHIFGLESLAAKYNLPVYITESTLNNCRLQIKAELIHFFQSNERIRIGALTIKAFTKLHDGCDPHSFVVQDDEDVCIGIFTDFGKACEQIIYHFKQCNAVFLEANYDDDMLASGNYPYFLKRRIGSDYGHLSNTAALKLFCTHRSKALTHLILSHLSKNNNCPELVEKLFTPYAGNTKIIIASRYHETEIFSIHRLSFNAAKKTNYTAAVVQLSMF